MRLLKGNVKTWMREATKELRCLKKVGLVGGILIGGLLYSQESFALERPFVVCIDPGHQAKGDPKSEPVAPGSGQRKARVASGTAGVATKKAEYEVNLEAALRLKALLAEKGYEVVMTRERHDVNISNAERAELANRIQADMTIRIHCDSIGNGGKTGATLIVPGKESTYTQKIYPESYRFANCLKQTLEERQVKVNGIFERQDMTGFNWSKVPAIIFEMGFMSNYQEDRMLSDPQYQQKLMEAVVQALENYQVESNDTKEQQASEVPKDNPAE